MSRGNTSQTYTNIINHKYRCLQIYDDLRQSLRMTVLEAHPPRVLQRSHTNPAKHQLLPPLLLMHFLGTILSGIILDAMCNIMYQYVQCNLSLRSKREVQQQLQLQMSITQQGDMIRFKTIVVLHLVNRLYKLLQIYISNSSCTGSTFVAQKISTD